MDLYKVTVHVDGRGLDVVVKPGILATVETGSHQDKATSPKFRVAVLVGDTGKNMAGWIQLTEFDRSGSLRVTHEGWVSDGVGEVASLTQGGALPTSLTRMADPTPEMRKCQENAEFGPLACCTAYGDGCYVKCCGGCCSDPVGCPGASCCP